MKHDKSYRDADEGIGTRHEADKKMLEDLNKLENKKLNWNEYFAKYFTKAIIGIKYKLGLGLSTSLELIKKPIKKPKRVLVYNIEDLPENYKEYKYVLIIKDTKFSYAIPLKTKSSKEIMEAFTKLFSKKFKVGDKVIVKNWSKEIFIITKVKKNNIYHIEDLNGDGVIGSFYESELQHSKF